MTAATYDDIASGVIAAVGGEGNVVSIAHCATRLRVVVADKDKVNEDAVEGLPKVSGFFFHSGQFQIIFGTGVVNRVFEAVEKLGLSTASKKEQADNVAAQGTALQRTIRTFSDVFVPLIPALVATGLFMGLRGLLTRPEVLGVFGLTPDAIPANFILFTQILTDTAFIFLPAMVAWSACRVFGGNPLIGLVLGLMMVHPSLPNAWAVGFGEAEALTFFGFVPVVGFQGSVIPAFIVGLLAAFTERRVRRVIPVTFDLVLTPFLTLLIMSILGLFVIGPVFHWVEHLFVAAAGWMLDLPFGISGLIIGFVWDIIVVTGIHHVANLLEIQLLATTGVNPFNAMITGAIAAQGAACLAVGLKTKDKKLRALALPSTVSAFLGIIEPAIFGVTLRYYKPFIMALIAGGLSGFTASILGMSASGMAVTVIPGTLLYLDGQLFNYFLVNLVAIGSAFALTWQFGFSDDMLDKKAKAD